MEQQIRYKQLPKKAQWYQTVTFSGLTIAELRMVHKPTSSEEEKRTAKRLTDTRQIDQPGLEVIVSLNHQVTRGARHPHERRYLIHHSANLFHYRDGMQPFELELDSWEVDAPDFLEVQKIIKEITRTRGDKNPSIYTEDDDRVIEITPKTFLYNNSSSGKRLSPAEIADMISQYEDYFEDVRIRHLTLINVSPRQVREANVPLEKLTGYKTLIPKTKE
ncbi:hypothetical protein HY483_02765 [Candidatus Woesearchaeota archaeon]|nr:hypothetical protein [Candidatus Woesearchaeota archaeon]